MLAATLATLFAVTGCSLQSSKGNSAGAAEHNTPAADTNRATDNTQTSNGAAEPKAPDWSLVVALVSAVLVSLLVAGLIGKNQTPPWDRAKIGALGGVIAVVLVALVIGGWEFSGRPPNKTLFLIAADFLTLSLLGLLLCYIPTLIDLARGITSVFVRITLMLSIAGAAGGLGAHIFNHDGGLVLPELTEYTDVVTQKPLPSTKTSVNAQPDATPGLTGYKEVTRPSFHIGFLGDILLGILAANVLHLALANLLAWTNNALPSLTQLFTVLALGILAGFGGAGVLSSWSQKMLNPSEVAAIARAEVKEQTGAAGAAKTPLSGAARVAQDVVTRLTRVEWPDDAMVARMKDFASAANSASKSVDDYSTDELLAAAATNLFTKEFGSFNADKYLKPLLNTPNAPANYGWAARMLRVLGTTCNGTRSAAKGWYGAVQADFQPLSAEPVPQQRQAAAILITLVKCAAVIDKSLISPEWDQMQVDSNAIASSPSADAAKLTTALVGYLKDPNKLPTKETLPADPSSILRIVTAMHAAPKAFLQSVSNLFPALELKEEIANAPDYSAPGPAAVESTPKQSGSPANLSAVSPAPTSVATPSPPPSPSIIATSPPGL